MTVFSTCLTEQYNVDKSQISVSGVSSGAAFATQIHVIFSSHIMGIGMIAGGKSEDEIYLGLLRGSIRHSDTPDLFQPYHGY